MGKWLIPNKCLGRWEGVDEYSKKWLSHYGLIGVVDVLVSVDSQFPLSSSHTYSRNRVRKLKKIKNHPSKNFHLENEALIRANYHENKTKFAIILE